MVKGFNKKVYLIGIGGISMSAIARILKKNGHEVAGSDRLSCDCTKKLEGEGIKVNYSHKASNIRGFDTIVYTSAIGDNNKELVAARSENKDVKTRAEALALISHEYEKVVAISGSHGKTTATSITASILGGALKNFAAHIGGNQAKTKDNLLVNGDGGVFLTEACEYKDNFLTLKPDIGVILNIAPDHLDYFKTEENLVASFIKFASGVKRGGTIILNKDDKNTTKILEHVGDEKRVLTFSLTNKTADYYITEYTFLKKGFKFKVNQFEEEFVLNIGGEHNLLNALVGLIIAKELGVSGKDARAGLCEFGGVCRRYEEVGEVNGAKVVLDYAHHPDEIIKVIEEARKETAGKVFCLFQPHTYSRTKALWSEFIYALTKADLVMLYPVYPAREKAIYGVTSKRLAYDIRRLKKTSYYASSLEEHYTYLKYFAKVGDVVLVLGAGDIDNFRKFF